MYKESVLRAIEELNAIDANSDLAYEKAILTLTSIRMLPVLLYKFNETFPVYRTRTHLVDTPYNRISEISITPCELVTKFARCNKPNQSLFYCSDRRPTSYMELVEYWVENTKAEDKIYVTLGRWEIKRPMNVLLITSPDAEKRISEYDKYNGEALDEFINGIEDTDLRESHVIFYRYMFELFRKPAKNDLKTYIITTAYCNLAFLELGDQVDAIYYPSVPFGGEGDNFAIRREFCTPENIVLTHVIRNEFTASLQENGKHSFQETNFIQAARVDFEQGNIHW